MLFFFAIESLPFLNAIMSQTVVAKIQPFQSIFCRQEVRREFLGFFYFKRLDRLCDGLSDILARDIR